MKKRTKFIQIEFYTNYDEPRDYLVIIETINNKPVASYTLRVPVGYPYLPRFPHISN